MPQFKIKDTINGSLNIDSHNSIPKPELDYVDTVDTFVIYNVPILATMVQPYSDGYALKDKEEIQKVKVQNIPLTMRNDKPGHPDSHLQDMETTEDVAKNTVGYMREVTKKKDNASPLKKYADFVLYKTPKTSVVIDNYLKGNNIDTSIGFVFDKDETPGIYNGMKYDYVQRNIFLDHNAILMDPQGYVTEGRMPSPIGGIGADSNDINEGVKVKQEEIDALQTKNVEIQKQFDELKKADALVVTERDQLKAQVDALKIEYATFKAASDEVKKQLDAYKTKEANEINEMRKELKTKYTDVAELFDTASDDLIRQKYADMKKRELEAKSSRDVRLDMMGPSGKKEKSEHDRIKSFANQESKK